MSETKLRTLPEEIEARILGGRPFTHGDLCAEFSGRGCDELYRVVDKVVQRLRRKGKIAFKREGRFVVWSVVP